MLMDALFKPGALAFMEIFPAAVAFTNATHSP